MFYKLCVSLCLLGGTLCNFLKSKIWLLLILLLSIQQIVYPNKEIEGNISRGLEHSYHFRWEKAEETFRDMIDKYPGKPEGYHYLSGIYVWYYLSSKDKNDLKTFTSISDTAVDLTLDLLDDDPENDQLLYIAGANYSYRAIVFGTAGNYLDAAWASKRSESFLRKALEVNPELYDAYLGLGLYNYAISHIPPAFRWVLKLAGISGDRELGMHYIKLAADKGSLSQVEAQYYYSQIISEIYSNYNEASVYLNSLIKKYPENILFNYSLASLKIKQRKQDDAEKILRKILKKDDEKFIQVISFSNFLMSEVFFKKNQFDSAVVYYTNFLNKAPDNDYTGIASYRMGISYEILDDRDTAAYYFRESSRGNMDIEDDIFAKRKGKIYSSRTMVEEEIELVKSRNLIDSGNYSAAYDSLVNLLDKIIDEELKAEAYLYLSDASFYLGNYEESLSLASAALKTKIENEKWILPFANYYAARANFESGDMVAANYFIRQAENYNDYDYQGRLESLINSLKLTKQF